MTSGLLKSSANCSPKNSHNVLLVSLEFCGWLTVIFLFNSRQRNIFLSHQSVGKRFSLELAVALCRCSSACSIPLPCSLTLQTAWTCQQQKQMRKCPKGNHRASKNARRKHNCRTPSLPEQTFLAHQHASPSRHRRDVCLPNLALQLCHWALPWKSAWSLRHHKTLKDHSLYTQETQTKADQGAPAPALLGHRDHRWWPASPSSGSSRLSIFWCQWDERGMQLLRVNQIIPSQEFCVLNFILKVGSSILLGWILEL